jgi:tetratricopeptide (TPR) repeat protein
MPPAQSWTPPPKPQPLKPLILGPQSAAEGEGDLWNLVKPAAPQARPPGAVASFEEALKRVDASLEALVDAPRSSLQDAPVEATVEAEVVEPGGPTEETAVKEDDLADPSDPNEAARQRRQRLLRRAMENLGAIPAPRSDKSSATTDPNLPVTDAPKPKVDVPKATADDLQLKAQVEKRYDDLQKKRELYAILGVPIGGAKDQVKNAFLAMAKVFHPDRLPPSLPDLAPKMNAVFESIREAYETLYDDARRAAYMSQMASGGPRGAASGSGAGKVASADSGEAMRLGDAAFKKRDYRAAEQAFARAYELDKSAVSLSAQAWAIYMDPQRKGEAQQAKALMTKALQLDSNCDRAHYQLGVIARVEGDMDRAENHFRNAVRTNPRHLEAAQELRLIEMRKKKATTTKGGGGFFSR